MVFYSQLAVATDVHGEVLNLCQACGAVVFDTGLHTEWHENLDTEITQSQDRSD